MPKDESIVAIDPNIRLELNEFVLSGMSLAAVEAAGNNIVGYIEDELNSADRNDTGGLASSWVVESKVVPKVGAQAEVYSTLPPLQPTGRTLADIVNNGTGIYGPYGTPIVSPYGGVMRFNPGRKTSAVGKRGVRNNPSTGRFESAYVYAYSVKGQQGIQFIEKAHARINLATFIP